MAEKTQIKLFEDKKVRTIWDSESEEWYFSVVDVCNALAESASKDPGAYWRKLKQRLKAEGSEVVTNCHGLKLPAADGKSYKTDCLDAQGIFRLIQSIPSPKAEPFKLWMAQVAKERLDEMQDPEQGIQRALLEYRALGYSENWINQRLKSIEIRKDLTDEWKKHGLKEGVQFATLTDIIYKTWAGKTAKEYKEYKGLKKELTETLRRNKTIDWQKKESARARMRMIFKKLLKKYKYPPEGQEDALKTVISQCEMWTDAADGFMELPPQDAGYVIDGDAGLRYVAQESPAYGS